MFLNFSNHLKQISKVVSTHLWNTPRKNLYQQAILAGIPFIIGVAGGLPNGCAISRCVVIFLENLSKSSSFSDPTSEVLMNFASSHGYDRKKLEALGPGRNGAPKKMLGSSSEQ